jgi:hypothetical protein
MERLFDIYKKVRSEGIKQVGYLNGVKIKDHLHLDRLIWRMGTNLTESFSRNTSL